MYTLEYGEKIHALRDKQSCSLRKLTWIWRYPFRVQVWVRFLLVAALTDLIGKNDDSSGCGINTQLSEIQLSASDINGGIAYIVVGGYGDSEGDFHVSFKCACKFCKWCFLLAFFLEVNSKTQYPASMIFMHLLMSSIRIQTTYNATMRDDRTIVACSLKYLVGATTGPLNTQKGVLGRVASSLGATGAFRHAQSNLEVQRYFIGGISQNLDLGFSSAYR